MTTPLYAPLKATTPKKLEELLNSGAKLFFSDPNYFQSNSRFSDSIEDGDSFICTNHPQRSWYARVSKANGRFTVVS